MEVGEKGGKKRKEVKIMEFSYDFGFVQVDPVISEVLGEDVTGGRHKAVSYNEEGKVVIATETSKAVGLLLSTLENEASKGDSVDVLIHSVGFFQVAEAVAKGDLLAVDSEGRGVLATKGGAVFGQCLSGCEGSEGGIVKVLLKGGMCE